MLTSLFLLPVLALASPALYKRDDTAIVQALTYVNHNITVVSETLDTFNKPKDAITAFKIQIQTDAVIKSVQNAASVSNASEPLNDAQSENVAAAVLQLQPNINSLLDKVVAHKPQFETALFGYSAVPVVKLSLTNAKKAADDFGAALVPRLSPAFQQVAPLIVEQIDAKFNEAIAAFS